MKCLKLSILCIWECVSISDGRDMEAPPRIYLNRNNQSHLWGRGGVQVAAVRHCCLHHCHHSPPSPPSRPAIPIAAAPAIAAPIATHRCFCRPSLPSPSPPTIATNTATQHCRRHRRPPLSSPQPPAIGITDAARCRHGKFLKSPPTPVWPRHDCGTLPLMGGACLDWPVRFGSRRGHVFRCRIWG